MLSKAFRKLSIDTIRIVSDVLDSGSLTQVARLSGISQPAVSLHIRKFEEATGLTVVQRVGNELVPSNYADEISVACKTILRTGSLLEEYSRARADRRKRLGMNQDIFLLLAEGSERAKSLIAKYMVVVDSPVRLMEDFSSGDIDALIRPLFAREALPELAVDVPFRWIGSSAVEVQNGDDVPVIMHPAKTPYGSMARAFLAANVKRYNVTFETSDMSALKAAVRSGSGYAYVPAFASNEFGTREMAGIPEPLCHQGIGSFGIFTHKNQFPFREAEDIYLRVSDFIRPKIRVGT